VSRYVAFLRAINVGGRFIKMATLSAHFETLGHTQVQTFINSGNVMFNARARSADAVALALEAGLAPLLGFHSEAFVRTVPQLLQIAERAQALLGQAPPGGEVNVGFLAAPLSAEQQAALRSLGSATETLFAEGTELYWSSTLKQHQSKVSNAAIERKLKLRTTLRRASMLQNLAERLGQTT
jgi:uncharacterized protein (DUF1697 family)